MKIINLVLGILFALFALVQYNDPDPWGWAALYCSVALICGLAAFGKAKVYQAIIGLVVSIVWLIALLPEFIHWIQMGAPSIVDSMKAEAPHIEFTREFLGLFLCILAFSWQWYRLRKA